MNIMKRLENKVAIITGGSRALRFGIAKEIANQGAKAMLVDIGEKSLKKKVEEAKNEELDMSYVVADATKPEDVKKYIKKSNKRNAQNINGVSHRLPTKNDGGHTISTLKSDHLQDDLNFKNTEVYHASQ